MLCYMDRMSPSVVTGDRMSSSERPKAALVTDGVLGHALATAPSRASVYLHHVGVPESGLVEATGLTVPGQKNSRAIAVDDTWLFVGTSDHVLKIHKQKMTQDAAFAMNPYSTCTCMTSSTDYLFVGAIKGKATL